MTYRLYDLVDVSVNVDISGLESKLDEIEQKIDNFEPDESAIADIVRNIANDEGYLSTSELSNALGDEDVIMGTDLDDRIGQYLSGESYVVESDVQSIVDERIQSFASDSTVEDIAERVEALEGRVDSVAQDKIIELGANLDAALARIAALEDRIASADKATRFFDLLREAVLILRR